MFQRVWGPLLRAQPLDLVMQSSLVKRMFTITWTLGDTRACTRVTMNLEFALVVWFRKDSFRTLQSRKREKRMYVRLLMIFDDATRRWTRVSRGWRNARQARCCEKGRRTFFFCRWCINSADFACTVSWTRRNWDKKGRTRFLFVRHFVTVACFGVRVALLANLSTTLLPYLILAWESLC